MEELEIKVGEKVDNKELETTLLEGNEISETKIENSLNYDKLTPEEKSAIDTFLT